ncbi:hypothetical protein [Bradyrhizobium sp. SZCCHNS3004]|uniref:hypothetical protein n=1 Tax=Bradyrhizobium sp. SZCCHNS3004 TaxID=3057312 RepID=UPI0029167227|nr:hypothetical protein [Bradyrhizobium sp. SZCCHNS3004]
MAKTERKVPVTMRALLARINRRLARDDQALRSCRSDSRWWRDLGDHYVVDVNRNIIQDTFVDPVIYGSELGVMQPFECVIDEAAA